MWIFGGYNPQYALIHPWVIVSNMYRRTKWFIQRGWRGYADCDAWDLHGYLTKWLPKALRDLQDNKLGYPVGLKCRCEWDRILMRIIRGFEANKKIIELDFMDGKKKDWRKEYKRLVRESSQGRLLFHKHFNSLWD